MKIASWNVNSLKARREHVEKVLEDGGLDVLMVQELKGEEFPTDDFEKLVQQLADSARNMTEMALQDTMKSYQLDSMIKFRRLFIVSQKLQKFIYLVLLFHKKWLI